MFKLIKSLTVGKVRRMLKDQSDECLAAFIDNNAHRILIDYTKLDFPSLMVYLCQRRGTKKYIGDMFKVRLGLLDIRLSELFRITIRMEVAK